MKLRAGISESLFVFIGSLVFFLCTLSSNFSGPHDSIGYLNGIVKGSALFHQHHLLYHFTTHYWLVLVRPVFSGVPDYYLVEAFTAIWGSGSLAIVYSFFRNRFGLSWSLSLVSTSVAAFSYGMWFYSVNVEVYAPPMFFLLAALYILSRANISQRDFIIAALLQSVAILFHQVHILFTVTMLFMLWKQRRHIGFARALLQYAAIGIVLVGGAYFWVGWIVEGNNSFASWMQWLQGYAGGSDYWQPVNARTPVLVATGLSHAFIGGHFVFRLPGMGEYLNRAASGHSLSDELYLVRNLSEGAAIFLLALTLVLAFMMVWLCIRFFRRYKTIRKTWQPVLSPLLVTALVYSLFFCFWEPEILEFWIFQTVLFWLIVLGPLAHDRRSFPFALRPIVAIALVGVSLFVINFFGSIRYLLKLENDLYYTRTLPAIERVTPGDVVLLQDGWILKDFLEYYTPARILTAPVPATGSARNAVDGLIVLPLFRGERVFIYPEDRGGQVTGDTRYIDSLLRAHSNKVRTVREANPKILVIDPALPGPTMNY